MTEKLKHKGRYVLEIINLTTGQKQRVALDNMLMSYVTEQYQKLLRGTADDTNVLKIKYFAFGDNDTPANAGQTALGNERFRKQITAQQTVIGGVITTCALRSDEANFNIKEIGVFCGTSATASANTGGMMSRVIVDINKNDNLQINVLRTDYISI